LACVRIGKHDTHVTIKKPEVVIIAGNEKRPAPIPPRIRTYDVLLLEAVLNQSVKRASTERTFSMGAKYAKTIETG
jgi:hypothetical protein